MGERVVVSIQALFSIHVFTLDKRDFDILTFLHLCR